MTSRHTPGIWLLPLAAAARAYLNFHTYIHACPGARRRPRHAFTSIFPSCSCCCCSSRCVFLYVGVVYIYMCVFRVCQYYNINAQCVCLRTCACVRAWPIGQSISWRRRIRIGSLPVVTAHALPLAVCWPAVAGHMCVHVQLMNVRARVVYMCVVCRRNARRGRSDWGSRAERAQLQYWERRACARAWVCVCMCHWCVFLVQRSLRSIVETTGEQLHWRCRICARMREDRVFMRRMHEWHETQC